MMSPAEYPDRVWFYPAKFWAATKHMQPDDADKLLNEVIRLAEAQDLEALRNFDFVSYGNPWRKRPEREFGR